MSKPSRAQRLDEAATALFGASALLDQVRLMIWDRENLTVTQLRLLGHLLQQEGLSNAELAERLYVTRPSVSALLERLERGGFIRREVSSSDRRGINIWLEPRGRAAVESLRQELREYTAGLMDDMSDDEVDAFISVVGRFVASAVRAGRAISPSKLSRPSDLPMTAGTASPHRDPHDILGGRQLPGAAGRDCGAHAQRDRHSPR